MITMSVNRRIYQMCQLDDLAEHYGLIYKPDPRPGFWFVGPEAAWRELANDVDFRSVGGWSRDCATRKSDSLHGRIDRYLAKHPEVREGDGIKVLSDMLMVAFK